MNAAHTFLTQFLDGFLSILYGLLGFCGLGFALCEKVSASALIRLTDIAEFSLALTVVCEDTQLHATLRL